MGKADQSLDVFGLDWGQSQYTGKTKQKEVDDAAISFTTPDKHDGALVIDELGQHQPGGGGRATAQLSFQADYRNEHELISLYRRIAQEANVENAIDDIVDDAIVMDSNDDAVSIDLDACDGLSESVKNAIQEEFKTILNLMKFRDYGDEHFRKWYVDGRQHFHMVVDVDHPEEGLKELRQIDSRNIQLIREIQREMRGHIEVVKGIREYYLYTDPRMGATGTALEISPEAISYVTSGLVDAESQNQKGKSITGYTKEVVISHLHKAIKPFNRLNQLEDALVIYRISRAPERLVFYVDTGNLNKSRSDAYLKENMNKYKNKLVYDSSTGKVKNDRHIMSVMENVWLPRKQGTKGTEVSSLSGAMNLGQIEDVDYFKRGLLEALKTPTSRLEGEGGMMGTGTTEISRDELKFSKFISKLRNRYSKTFLIFLKTQLILKNICTQDDWDEWRNDIKFDWASDSYFSELKEQEIIGARLEALQAAGIEQPIGTYFSHAWVRKNILRQSVEEIEEEDKQIAAEKDSEQFKTEEQLQNERERADAAGGGFGNDETADDDKPKGEPPVKKAAPKEKLTKDTPADAEPNKADKS